MTEEELDEYEKWRKAMKLAGFKFPSHELSPEERQMIEEFEKKLSADPSILTSGPEYKSSEIFTPFSLEELKARDMKTIKHG